MQCIAIPFISGSIVVMISFLQIHCKKDETTQPLNAANIADAAVIGNRQWIKSITLKTGMSYAYDHDRT